MHRSELVEAAQLWWPGPAFAVGTKVVNPLGVLCFQAITIERLAAKGGRVASVTEPE